MLNGVALLIPVFLLLVFIEWYISYKRRDNRYNAGNISMNLTIGAIDQIASLVYFTVMFLVMQYVYNHFSIIENNSLLYQWVLGYIIVDFIGYWSHRLSHRVNILWAGHVTHHSSSLYNLSNGFRTSLFQGVNRIIFWSVLPVFGFEPTVLVIIFKVSGIFDFLQHTEYIPKLGVLEKIFITPSIHRVHHGKNDIYIDKNYGSNFVIWDKLFGTYQEETEKVVYGIKSSYTDNNPLSAIGHHYRYLWKSMKELPRWKDKIKLLFMPPEWKPAVTPSHPAQTSESVFITPRRRQIAYLQIACCVVAITGILVFKYYLSNWEIIGYSLLVILTMSNATMVINNYSSIKFEKKKITKLAPWLVPVLISVILVTNSYIFYYCFFS